MSHTDEQTDRPGTTWSFTRFSDGSAVGDVIPFFDDGTYHLFVLTPPLGTQYFPERLRTTWRHLRSRDLLHWEELPDALAPGVEGSPDDHGIWTGCAIRAGDRYHIFYTGYSLTRDVPQSICHATSDDGITWVKDPDNPVSVPQLDRFEGKDWRDPFVFWNEQEGRYWMLLSTRSLRQPAAARGLVALQTSTDLKSWSEPEDFHEAFLTHCPECSEVFQIDGRWLLGYSRFTDRRGTVYRFADNPRGPWHHFDSDGPDGAHWYAAKSLTDDLGRRLAFGWVPDRNPKPWGATGPWLWAGDLALPRELSLGPDGRLRVELPSEVAKACVPVALSRVEVGSGSWAHDLSATGGSAFSAQCDGRFGYCVLHPAQQTTNYMVSATIRPQGAAIIGIAVETGDQLDRGAAVLCYTREGRALAVDLTAAWSDVADEYEKATTEYAPAVDSALGELPPAFDLRIVVRGDLMEAFVAGRAVLTYRLSSSGDGVALLVQDGSAVFDTVALEALEAQGDGLG